jgi:hypothetical protein
MKLYNLTQISHHTIGALLPYVLYICHYRKLLSESFKKIGRLIDCLLFYVPVKNFSLEQKHQFMPMLMALLYHTCCDTGPRFVWSYTNDRCIQSSLTTHKEMRMIYSNPDPHSIISEEKNMTLHYILPQTTGHY